MIASLAVATVSVVAFAWAFITFDIVRAASAIVQSSMAGVSAMLDSGLDDEAKELAVQRAGIAVLKHTGSAFVRFALALAVSAAVVYGADILVVSDLSQTMALMLNWPFILGTTTVSVVIYYVLRRRAPAKEEPADAGSDYTSADQFVHRLAFSGPRLQRALARFEDRIFAEKLNRISDTPPIFITGLPRAGTTVVLNALARVPEVATHTYRDMPLVLSPLLWQRASRPFARRAALRERAHGDGLEIGLDSPEAFEEAVWRTLRPQDFTSDRLPLLGPGDYDGETVAFLTAHFRKIRAARNVPDGRYVSKNNGNIARLNVLPEMFPGCRIVTPVRDPIAHAASLLRQHRNFLDLHSKDPFGEAYMRDIGHFEFGRLHKPIAFAGVSDPGQGPDLPDYWLTYWIAAHGHILDHADRLILVTHEALCADPDGIMRALCAQLDLDDSAGVEFASLFRPTKPSREAGRFDPALRAKAQALYRQLESRAISAHSRILRTTPDNSDAEPASTWMIGAATPRPGLS